MAAANLDPDSTISSAWTDGTGSTHAEINDASDSTYVADTTPNGEVSRFGFSATPGDFSSLNSLTLNIRHERVGNVDDMDVIDVKLYDNGGTQVGSTKTLVMNDAGFDTDPLTDAAWDALGQTDLDGMEVDITAVKNAMSMPDGATLRVAEIQAVLDYNAAAPSVGPPVGSLAQLGVGK